jgi:methyl-accepting chemotaxis protein
MPKLDNQTIELALIAVTAFALLLQAIVLLAMYLALRKAITSLGEEVADLRTSLTPMVENSRELVDHTRVLVDNTRHLFARLAPKAEATAGDVARIARGLREQTEEVGFAAKDILERARRQTDRLDAMTTDALDAVDRAGNFVAETVGRPVRQFAGLLAAAKAIVESLRGSAPKPRQALYSRDQDRFV